MRPPVDPGHHGLPVATDHHVHALLDGGPPRHDATHDLAPLAWVHDELRKTVDAAAKCLQRYRREADAAAEPFYVPGLQHLLQAAQLLHQCAGALHMVEQPACAALADAMQSAVQRFAEQQQPCTDEAVAQVEQAGLALTEYLQAVLVGKPVAAVALFPQYREVRALAGAARVHPVELWHAPDLAPSVALPADAEPLHYAPALRGRFDQAVLKLVKTADPGAAQALHDLALGLAAGSAAPPQRTFWHLAAAYFQALALGLVPADLYTKRIASGVLTQYAALARGEPEPAATLVRELLFYCARAVPPDGAAADTLAAVRAAHGLDASGGVPDYTQRRFARFNPAQVTQARKRIAAACDTWSAVADGDARKLKAAHEQLVQVADALAKLHDDSAALTHALTQAADAAWRAGGVAPAPPSAALALEMATALLYLETAYADLDRSGADMRAHAEQLANRLAQVQQGETPQPQQAWLAALHQEVSEPHTMASVAAQLGGTLGEVEQALNQFFRAPREKAVLAKVVVQLSQMHGVLSALELPQAAHAALRMRDTVDGYMADAADDATMRDASFARLASSVAALGDLIDMLGYQRSLAQTLFIDDEEQGFQRRRASPPVEAPPAPTTAPAPEDSVPPPTASTTWPPDGAAEQPTGEPAPREPDPVDRSAAPGDPADLAEGEDHIRQVGPLRIALPLYNAFLNDADEWSRQLQAELGEWALQQPRPPEPSSAALARALADSAAGVGFDDLAQLADLLDQVLQRLRQQAQPPAPPSIQPPLDAAEEIRRLLHQFAAGFLKPVRDTVLQALRAWLQVPTNAIGDTTPHVDGLDAIDTELFPVFEHEAVELLPRLASALRQWHAAPADTAARQQALRTLHTFKGGARLAGALRLSALAHRLESAADQVPADVATPPQIEPLLAQADRLQQALDHLRAQVHGATAPLLDEVAIETREPLGTPAPVATPLGAWRASLADLDAPLDRLRSQLHELTLHAEAQMHARLAQAGEDAVALAPSAPGHDARTQELARTMAESLADVCAVQRQLQRTLRETEAELATQGQQEHAQEPTRLVAFDAIAKRLHGVVRHTAIDLGRTVQLDIVGGHTEVDSALLDRLAPVLDHLLRNAVVHGIEDAQPRALSAKPANGAIRMTVAQVAEDLTIAVHDDGSGLDLPRLQAAAVSRGLLAADAQLPPAEAAKLAYLPGMTTITQPTELAGRGIGLDVVRTEVQALGGRVEVTSTPGVGTQFTLVLPRTAPRDAGSAARAG